MNSQFFKPEYCQIQLPKQILNFALTACAFLREDHGGRRYDL